MRKKPFDTQLLIAILILVIFGIIMISSVSVYESYQITNDMVKKGLLDSPTNSFYLIRHIKRAIISIPIFISMIYIPLNFWKKIAPFLFVAAVLLLSSLFLPGVGSNYGTSTSWITVSFLPSLQPAEFVKLALILYLAVWMEKREEQIRTMQYGFFPFTILLSFVVGLLAFQPDFGSVLVISVIAVAMFFAAGGNILHIFSGALASAAIVVPIIMSKEYIRNRFMVFFNPSIDPLNIGFQVKQALIAIGNGGLFGVGIGKSIQKFGYLPEVQGDTIFAATAEELGFILILVFLSVYIFIAYKGFNIAKGISNRFIFLVAVGITSWFTFQAIINIGVNLAILPLTGLTLPFISYGGSSLIANMIAAGILLNISRYAENTNSSSRRRVRRTRYPQPSSRYRA